MVFELVILMINPLSRLVEECVVIFSLTVSGKQAENDIRLSSYTVLGVNCVGTK